MNVPTRIEEMKTNKVAWTAGYLSHAGDLERGCIRCEDSIWFNPVSQIFVERNFDIHFLDNSLTFMLSMNNVVRF